MIHLHIFFRENELIFGLRRWSTCQRWQFFRWPASHDHERKEKNKVWCTRTVSFDKVLCCLFVLFFWLFSRKTSVGSSRVTFVSLRLLSVCYVLNCSIFVYISVRDASTSDYDTQDWRSLVFRYCGRQGNKNHILLSVWLESLENGSVILDGIFGKVFFLYTLW